MEELIIVLFRGLGLGSVFALIVLGFNITFNSSGILNFAHGGWIAVAGIIGFLFLGNTPSLIRWILVGVACLIVVSALVAVQGYLTLKPLTTTDQHSWLVSTLAVSTILSAGILIALGANPMRVSSPFGTVSLAGVPIPGPYLASIGALALWILALSWFHSRTASGLAMRAIAQDLDAGRAIGIRVRHLQIVAFAISGALAATVGFVAGPVLTISAFDLFFLLIDGFLAAVIGGVGSNKGAVVGGLIVGVFIVTTNLYVGANIQALASLVLLVVVLAWRPRGLFGKTRARRV